MNQARARSASTVESAVDVVSVIGLAILCAVAFLWDVVLVRVMASLNMNDFGRFYYSARAFLAGHDMYAPSPATQLAGAQQLFNLNPPHFHLVVIPLAALPPSLAVSLWMVASVLALLVSVWIIANELEFVPTAKRLLLIALFVLMFSGSQAEFITGQVTFLLLLPMVLCWRHARRGQWNRAAAWLGLCLSIKPFLLIFLPYLLGRRHWRASAVMLSTAAASFAVGLYVFGPISYASWLHALRQSGDWAWLGMNASTLGTFQRVFTTTPGFQPIVNAPAIASAWILVAGVIAFATLLVVFADNTKSATDRAFALLLTAAQLVSPVGWVYYLWLAVGPVAAIALPIQRRSFTPRSAIACCILAIPAAGFFAPITAPYYLEPSVWATVTLSSMYFWASLGLWVCLIVSSSRSAEAPMNSAGSAGSAALLI